MVIHRKKVCSMIDVPVLLIIIQCKKMQGVFLCGLWQTIVGEYNQVYCFVYTVVSKVTGQAR